MEVDIIRCYMSAIDMIGYIKKYGVEIILILAPRISIIEEKDLDERKREIMKKLEIQAREKSLENRSERYNSL